MQVSVVIPCHNGADLTAACLRSLLDQRGSPELEILLVDNASTDATASLAALHPCIRVLPQPTNLGFAGGVNAGLHAAQHDLLLVLNNDTQAARDLLFRLHAALLQQGVGLVAPVSNHVKGPARIAVGSRGATAEGRDQIAAELQQQHAGVVEDTDTLSGLCLLFRRSCWQRIGDFDERFGNGNFEDDDFCLRARLAGFRLLVVRDAFLHHEGHRTFQALGLDYRGELHARRAQFERKWSADPAGAACIALQHGDLGAAAAAALLARAERPLWPDGDRILGRRALELGDHRRAGGLLRAFVERCPAHTEARLLLGLALLQAGDHAAGSAQLHRTLAECFVTNAAAAQLFRRLADLAHAAGNTDDAIANLETAAALDADDAELRNWLGVALLAAGRVEAATDAFTLAAAGGFALAHTNLGICWHRRGEPAQALVAFGRAAELLPGDAVAAANLRQAQRAFQAPTC